MPVFVLQLWAPPPSECIFNTHHCNKESLPPISPFSFFSGLITQGWCSCSGSAEIRHVTGTVKINRFHGLSLVGFRRHGVPGIHNRIAVTLVRAVSAVKSTRCCFSRDTFHPYHPDTNLRPWRVTRRKALLKF